MSEGGVSINWQTHPNVIVKGTEEYKDGLVGAVTELVTSYGAEMQAFAMANAPWTDRTGNARQGLDYATIVEGYRIILVLFHRMSYGIWLEVANEGKYAIILKTIEEISPDLISAAQELVK